MVLIVWLIFTSLAAVLLWPFRVILILETLESLPVLLYLGLLTYVLIDVLVPNRRCHGVVAWMCWETVEHLGFPLVLITLMFLQVGGEVAFLTLALLLYLLYGQVFGHIRTPKDFMKTTLLVAAFMVSLYLPLFVWAMDCFYGFRGCLMWGIMSTVTLVAFVAYKQRPALFSLWKRT